MNASARKLILPALASVLLAGAISPGQDAAGGNSIDKLKKLGNACLLYAQRNGGKMPSSLAELYYKAYINSLEDFVCPANPAEILHRTEIEANSGYILSPGAAGTGDRAIVQDRTADNNAGKGINVFLSDGSVRWEAAPSGATGINAGAAGTVGPAGSAESGGAPGTAAGTSAAGAAGAAGASGISQVAGGGGGSIVLPGRKTGVTTAALILLLAASMILVSLIVLARAGRLSTNAGARQNISAILKIRAHDGAIKTYRISGKRTRIGRSPSCELQIDDPAVSAVHAEIFISGKSFVVRDLGSSNGTFVNGGRITEKPLYLGDEIALGSTRITLEG